MDINNQYDYEVQEIANDNTLNITENTKDVLLDFIAINKIMDFIFINLKTREKLRDDSIQTMCQKVQLNAKINQSINNTSQMETHIR